MHLVTSRGIYPRAVFKTVFAVHLENIIQEWLLQRPWLSAGKLQYMEYIIITFNKQLITNNTIDDQ